MRSSLSLVSLVMLSLLGSGSGMINSGTPEGVPADVDCALRALAWDYGKKILPERGEFRTLFDSLQLSYCNLTTPAQLDKYAAPHNQPPDGARIVYVAPDVGIGGGDGTLERPLNSLKTALEVAASSSEPTAVLLRRGTYHLDAPLLIGPEHSGLTLQNYPGEAVTLSGGRPFSLPKAAWKPFVQRTYWDPAPAFNNVYGLAVSGGDTPTVKYLGDLKSTAECRGAAEADVAGKGPYLSFTFHTPAFGGEFAGQCFGRTDDGWAPAAQAAVESGLLVRRNTWVASLDETHLGGLEEMAGLRLDGRRVIRAKYPNGDPEQSGEYLRGAGASMGGGDYVKGWMPLSAQTAWVRPFR